jgi:hypothetical protein
MRNSKPRSLPPTLRRRSRGDSPSFSRTLFRLKPRLETMEDRTLLSTFLVTTTDDDGPGSFRQAILDSNAATGGTNAIDFAIPGQGAQTIATHFFLPNVSQAVLIDGFSQPGYAGSPLIDVFYQSGPPGDGLYITGSDVTVRGLDINGFGGGAGIHLTGASATGDWIYGNFLGTDPTGTQAAPNGSGVEIDDGASKNLIGTDGDGADDVGERNLIAGNTGDGIGIYRNSTQNIVAGNVIGTDLTGALALGNGDGVSIATGAAFNTIGGTTAAAGNLITHSGGRGVVVGNPSDDSAVGNQITGNRIFANAGQAIDLSSDGVTYNSASPRLHHCRWQATRLAGGKQAQHDLSHRYFRQLRLRSGRCGRGRGLSRVAGGHNRQPGPGGLRRPRYSSSGSADRRRHRDRPPGQHLRAIGDPSVRRASAHAGPSPGSQSAGDLFVDVRRCHRPARPRCRVAGPGLGPDALRLGWDTDALGNHGSGRFRQRDPIAALSGTSLGA